MMSIDEKWILGEIVGHLDGAASWAQDRESLILDTESGSELVSISGDGSGRYVIRFGDTRRLDLPALVVELDDASTLIEAREMLDERLPGAIASLAQRLKDEASAHWLLAEALES